jgi:histidyl-tRNA synthetase
MVVEAELISAFSEILERLGFENFSILLNHREILRGILDVCGIEALKQTDALVALDKLDKIGKEGVLRELEERGFTDESIKSFEKFIDILISAANVVGEAYDGSGDKVINGIRRKDSINKATLESLSDFVGENESGKCGKQGDAQKYADGRAANRFARRRGGKNCRTPVKRPNLTKFQIFEPQKLRNFSSFPAFCAFS